MNATAPDLVEPIVGFREWLIVRGHLSSPYIPYRWQARIAHARCFPANRNLQFGRGWLEEPHKAPHPLCKCGIYARYRPRLGSPFPDANRIWGVVSLWGQIEAHRDGMRAEHARIEALSRGVAEPGDCDPTLRELASRLGLELVPWQELPAVAAEAGSALPEEMMPAD